MPGTTFASLPTERRVTPLDAMVKAARAAGRSLLRNLAKSSALPITHKGRGDFVSTADLAAEKLIAAVLRRAFPAYGFLMEESGLEQGRDTARRWVVDPLDGTTNFLRGVPYFAISIAFQERDRIAGGVVFDPLRKEMFTAVRGQGAFLNGRKLTVSACNRISEGLIATGVPLRSPREADDFAGQLDTLRARLGGIRSMGAAALDLAYVAAGRYDAYWEQRQAPWDIAAGMLLVEEAGGRCTDLAGNHTMLKSGTVLASNRHLHKVLQGILSHAGCRLIWK